MLVFAGIDEAGYGPRLGPLCTGGTVFVLAGHDPADGPPNLWRILRAAVCRKTTDRRRRIAVDDSKRLKGATAGPAHPLRHLERGVLSFWVPEAPPASDAELFTVLGTAVPRHPWLDTVSPLPLAHGPDELRIARGRLDRALRREGVRCEALWCDAVDPGDFNRRLTRCGGKAELNFRAALSMIDRVWQRWPDDHPRVVVDRHGGRTRYAGPLARGFPGASVEVVAETPVLSRYRLERGGSKLTVSFEAEGDARFLPAALASMTAKYVRDLLMLRLNRFFQSHVPQLRATWGYYGDAGRYLAEIKPVMRRLRVPQAELVRTL